MLTWNVGLDLLGGSHASCVMACGASASCAGVVVASTGQVGACAGASAGQARASGAGVVVVVSSA